MSQLEALLVKPLNHVLHGSPWATERLRRHAGAHVGLRAGPVVLSLSIDGQGLLQSAERGGATDVTIELGADFPARFLLDRDSAMSAARLSGSADVAETLAFVFRNIRWDAEADLADVIGDIPARRLTLAGTRLAHELRDGSGRLAGNLVEYATEEAGLLVSPASADTFIRDVDRLRDEMARLEKRIARLGG